MSAWRFEFSQGAEKDLAVLDRALRRRTIDRLDWLATNFNRIIPLPLGGEFHGFYKLRVGDWRVVYEVDWSEHLISIYYIDRRDKVYKKR